MAESVIERARRSLAVRGVGRTLRLTAALVAYRLRHGWRGPAPHAFDLEFGTDTHSLTRGHTLPGVQPGLPHEPVPPLEFEQLLATLPIDHREFDFIDFGCGQGRALLLAARYPYRRVIGVEYAWEIHESARRNVEIYARGGWQRAQRVEIILADALTWELPGSPVVIYAFDPVPKPQLWLLARRIRASLRAAPRPAYLLYFGSCPEVWERTGFVLMDTGAGQDAYAFRAYRYAGADAGR